MKCHPRCEVPLPDIGNAKVITSFDTCNSPAELTIRIIHEVRSTSIFLARDAVVDSRNIGTEHWPLRLNVQFIETKPDEYFAKACVITERLNKATCFMNSTFVAQDVGQCGTGSEGSSAIPLFILAAFLALLICAVVIGGALVIHRLFMRCCLGGSRRYHKQSQLTALIPSPEQKVSIEEDRLTVIEEENERDENSHLSPSPSSSGFDSMDSKVPSYRSRDMRSSPVPTVISTPRPFLQTFQPLANV